MRHSCGTQRARDRVGGRHRAAEILPLWGHREYRIQGACALCIVRVYLYSPGCWCRSTNCLLGLLLCLYESDRYCLSGDTVNTANTCAKSVVGGHMQMESNSERNRVTLSPAARVCLKAQVARIQKAQLPFRALPIPRSYISRPQALQAARTEAGSSALWHMSQTWTTDPGF